MLCNKFFHLNLYYFKIFTIIFKILEYTIFNNCLKRGIKLNKSVRTDLAIEARELYFEAAKLEAEKEIDGVDVETEKDGEEIIITRVKIKSDDAQELLSKRIGTYVTVEFPKDFSGYNNLSARLCEVCSKEIQKLIDLKNTNTTLVIGLGNWNITADSLGPKTVGDILVTRHLAKYMPSEIDDRLSSVSAAAPGVLGITGIETGEIVKGLCDRIKPDLVIAVDALCSRKIDRVNSTIQISNTGIVPGAGVGNKRMALDEETLKIPVIAIGIPTVVDAATIANDTIELIVGSLEEHAKENKPLYKMLSIIEEEDNMPIIEQALSPAIGNFIVTPKEIDDSVIKLSRIVADSINLALHNGITLEELELYRY